MAKKKLDPKLEAWIEARQRHRLSDAQVQMARELGMSPRGLGSIDNHDQEPWKVPLPRFIEELYQKRFGRARPEVVMSIEARARAQEQKKRARKEAKAARKAAPGTRLVIPDRKMSETILDFGAPIFAQLGPVPPIDAMRDLLQIVITIWNAHALATPLWGSPEHLAEVFRLARGEAVPPGFVDAVLTLAARRQASFSDDPRVVGAWAIEADGAGGHRFRCETRLPAEICAGDRQGSGSAGSGQ